SSRALHGIDAALDAADADTAGWRLEARLLEPRDEEALGHAGHVGQSRGEADEVDVVVSVRVEVHELVQRQAALRRRGLHLEAQLSLVAAGHGHRARRGQDLGPRLAPERVEGSGQLFPSDGERVVVDEQRAVAGNGLGDATQLTLPDQVLERENPRIDLAIDLVAQLDRERLVPARQKAGLGVDAHALENWEGGIAPLPNLPPDADCAGEARARSGRSGSKSFRPGRGAHARTDS